MMSGRHETLYGLRRSSLLLFAAALLLAACGDSPTEPTEPPPPSGKPETMTGNVGPYDVSSHPLEILRNGTLTVTLTWTGPADLDLYLTALECTGYPPDECLIYSRATAVTGNQEAIEWPVAAGEKYKVWIDNFSPTTSAAYTVTAVLR